MIQQNDQGAPWGDEPDEWRGEEFGLAVFARRNPILGNWCGYVALPSDHPWQGRTLEQLEGVNVHGGVTMTGMMKEYDGGEAWMVGFDCAHATDAVPRQFIMADHFPYPRPNDLAG